MEHGFVMQLQFQVLLLHYGTGVFAWTNHTILLTPMDLRVNTILNVD